MSWEDLSDRRPLGTVRSVRSALCAGLSLCPPHASDHTMHGTSCLRVRFHLRGAVTAVRSGFLGYSVFILCVSTTAGRRRDGGWCPRQVGRNGSWSHSSVPPRGAVAVWRQLAPSPLKYRSRAIDIKNTLIALKLNMLMWWYVAYPPDKFQSDWRIISISRLRYYMEF